MKNLGLRVQLGHPANERCLNPCRSAGGTFTVVHSNGVHDIALDFCDCETALPHSIQLLRRYWFPATDTFPHSAATIRVLKKFHLLAFEGKCSPYEYYNSLARATDNTGIYATKVSSELSSWILTKSSIFRIATTNSCACIGSGAT